MKKIKLLVEIEVPDNYRVDEPEWTLENAFLREDIYGDGNCFYRFRVVIQK